LSDVAVVGAGPAGVSASIYLKRAGFDVTLFEKNDVGGLLLNAYIVENYPGFPDGIEGKNLCKLMQKHLKKWGINSITKEVKKISIKGTNFLLETNDKKNEYKAVIIATGTKPKELDIPIKKGLIGHKIFYEIKDLLPKIKADDICTVIGGGDAAFDYSLNLANKCSKINIVFRSKKPKCLSLLEEKVKKYSIIKILPLLVPRRIYEEKGKLVIILNHSEKNKENLKVDKIKSDYILIACGRNPDDKLLTKEFKKSNIPGLYIAGDIRTGKFRQTGIAVGEGIYAAMCVESYLKGLKTC